MAPGEDVDLTRTPQAPLAPGDAGPSLRSWGDFRIVAELGRGGFGRVYHAWDATLARDIALKIVRLPDATEAAAALREGRMLARVRHRNIVTVHGAQQIGDEVGVWMELVRGRHLAQFVREQGPLGPEEATVVGISVCQALAAVHGAGLLHRDIKANNVMRESGGRIVLMDFGAGRESGPSRTGDLAGTPVYMAPEVLEGGAASARSDLYSVGVLLFFVVTGEYPVFGNTVLELSLAHRRGERRLLADRRPDLPDGFVRAVERALSPSPADRPPSAGAMLRDLAGALPGSSSWEGRTPETLRADLVTPRSIASGAADAAGAAARRRAAAWAAGLVLGFIGVGLLGLLTSVAFNQGLGREASFSTDGPVDWWVYGARSLVWPAVLAAIVILAGRLVVSLGQLVRRIAAPVARRVTPSGRSLRVLSRHLGAGSAVAVSQWLVLFQVIAIVYVFWRYQDFIQAFTHPAAVSPELLAILSPTSLTPLTYRSFVTLVMVGTGAAWFALLASPDRRAVIHRTTVIAGGAAMVLLLLMLVVPYRLLHHNEMPRTTFEGARCYELGQREAQVLLYCPDAPPEQRVKVADRTMLSETGVTVLESIFSEAPPLR